MTKVAIDTKSVGFPMPAMPVLLVGADVDGNANFLTIAWAGVACAEPLMVSVAIRHGRHTMKGVREGAVFSINVPTVDQARETDYCGIVSGAKEDKAKKCSFSVFYGKVPGAPFIRECPVNVACTVHETLDLGTHALVVGRVEETLLSEGCLTGGRPDAAKIRPLVFVNAPERIYRELGKPVGEAYRIGKELAK
ncbi:MAG TPA: flavin reductase family protein [bacterium]|nr:flavin reductase family protein [bacterium]